MENMFDLMNEELEVKDLPGSKPYQKNQKSPEVEFEEPPLPWLERKECQDAHKNHTLHIVSPFFVF